MPTLHFQHPIRLQRVQRQWKRARLQVNSKCAYTRGTKLPNAHPETFVVINESFAKDAEHVYSAVSDKAIAGADLAQSAWPGGNLQRTRFYQSEPTSRPNRGDSCGHLRLLIAYLPPNAEAFRPAAAFSAASAVCG